MNKLNYAILIALIGVFTLSSCGYNSMVNKQENVTAQWGQVQNAYQRRADLIPNLVSTVKGYASHEQETFTAVVEARAQATQTRVNPEDLTEESLQEYQQAQGQLGSALGKLLMIRCVGRRIHSILSIVRRAENRQRKSRKRSFSSITPLLLLMCINPYNSPLSSPYTSMTQCIINFNIR